MRVGTMLLVASALLIVTLGSIAQSGPAPTIQQCAKLLPKGKASTFSLVGSIDTSGAQPHLSGELKVSDDTTVDKQGEGAAFAQCVGKLVR